MHKYKILIAAIVLATLSGCSSISKGGYYWGDYSTSYYDYLKNPTEEQLISRIESLEEIIVKSGELDLRTPPAVHAELGQAYMKQGLVEKAKEHFRSEVSLYPESELFVRRLVSDL